MSSRTQRLLARDRAAFERVLDRALDEADARDEPPHIGAEPGRDAALRAEALASAERIAAPAGREYAAYLRLRTAAEKRAARRTRPKASSSRGVSAVLAVLAPTVSGAAAVLFLLIGGVFQLAGGLKELGESLVVAGWVAAAVAALALIAAMAGLLFVALRNRTAGKRAQSLARALERARGEWETALLERGIVPFVAQQRGSGRPPGRAGEQGPGRAAEPGHHEERPASRPDGGAGEAAG